jgi:hypothetical protein
LSKIRKVSVEKDFILAMLNWFLHLIYLKKIMYIDILLVNIILF